jgi:hypothetical protein
MRAMAQWRSDSHDIALAESIIGVFKTEVIQGKGRDGEISKPSNSRCSRGGVV